jgi:hypothetical protein
VKLVSHVGFPVNGYEGFRRTQSVEPISHFRLHRLGIVASYREETPEDVRAPLPGGDRA